MDVRIDNRRGQYGSGETGIAFRVVDSRNYWSAYYHNNSIGSRLALAYYQDGNFHFVGDYSLTVPNPKRPAPRVNLAIIWQVTGSVKQGRVSPALRGLTHIAKIC